MDGRKDRLKEMKRFAPPRESSNQRGDRLPSINEGTLMQQKSKSTKDYEDEYNYSHAESLKHWRSWGSWFSWGSPVGLGLFFISSAAALWILSQAFGWN